MADKKISQLTAATTPLAGTEELPVVQGGATVKVSVNNLTAGKSVSASQLAVDNNSSSTAVRITQTGAGNALVIEDSATPDSTPLVVNSDGDVISGAATAQSFPTGDGANRVAVVQVQGSLYTKSAIAAAMYNTAAAGGGGTVSLAKSNSATIGSHAVVASGDVFGAIFFSGSDGTNFIRGAQITASVDGTPGTNDMPGRLVFSTTADGASSPTERMRVDSAGNVQVGTAAIATNATNGFLYIPTCAGTPTGTPTTKTGLAPMVVDSTNNKLYVYIGGAWRPMN